MAGGAGGAPSVGVQGGIPSTGSLNPFISTPVSMNFNTGGYNAGASPAPMPMAKPNIQAPGSTMQAPSGQQAYFSNLDASKPQPRVAHPGGATYSPTALSGSGGTDNLTGYPGADRVGGSRAELGREIVRVATELGIDPVDLGTVISFETAGTFDPWIAGPTTQHGQHRGLIQWGEPQAAQYGVTADSTIPEQMEAVKKYLIDRGVQPGHSRTHVYSAILTGNASPSHWGRTDENNGGTPGNVVDKVNEQMAGHDRKANALLQSIGYKPGGGFEAVQPAVQRLSPSSPDRLAPVQASYQRPAAPDYGPSPLDQRLTDITTQYPQAQARLLEAEAPPTLEQLPYLQRKLLEAESAKIGIPPEQVLVRAYEMVRGQPDTAGPRGNDQMSYFSDLSAASGPPTMSPDPVEPLQMYEPPQYMEASLPSTPQMAQAAPQEQGSGANFGALAQALGDGMQNMGQGQPAMTPIQLAASRQDTSSQLGERGEVIQSPEVSPGNTNAPPTEAIQMLVENPGSADQFDEIFGQGMAARILGSRDLASALA